MKPCTHTYTPIYRGSKDSVNSLKEASPCKLLRVLVNLRTLTKYIHGTHTKYLERDLASLFYRNFLFCLFNSDSFSRRASLASPNVTTSMVFPATTTLNATISNPISIHLQCLYLSLTKASSTTHSTISFSDVGFFFILYQIYCFS